MTERYLSKEQSEQFNKHMEDFQTYLRNAVKEYVVKNKFADVTIVAASMAGVVREMCDMIRQENRSGGIDLEKHAADVFSNLVKTGIWANGQQDLKMKKNKI